MGDPQHPVVFSRAQLQVPRVVHIGFILVCNFFLVLKVGTPLTFLLASFVVQPTYLFRPGPTFSPLNRFFRPQSVENVLAHPNGHETVEWA